MQVLPPRRRRTHESLVRSTVSRFPLIIVRTVGHALIKDIDLAASDLNPDELAGLLAIDGSITQRRPSMEIEIRLRQLGLIERNGMSRLPTRTKRGNDLLKEGRAAAV